MHVSKDPVEALRQINASWHREMIEQCERLGMPDEVVDKYIKYASKKTRVMMSGKTSRSDSERSKVYAAESAFQMQHHSKYKQFKTLEEASRRMKQITSSKLWTQLQGHSNVHLQSARANARRFSGRAYHSGKIVLADFGLDEYTLIHELAHQTNRAMHHGVQFRINLLKLVSRFIGSEAASTLKAEFKARKLKVKYNFPRDPASWYKSYKRMEKIRDEHAAASA